MARLPAAGAAAAGAAGRRAPRGGMSSFWRPAYVAIGSNLDHPRAQVTEAFARLADTAGDGLVAAFATLQDPPYGPAGSAGLRERGGGILDPVTRAGTARGAAADRTGHGPRTPRALGTARDRFGFDLDAGRYNRRTRIDAAAPRSVEPQFRPVSSGGHRPHACDSRTRHRVGTLRTSATMACRSWSSTRVSMVGVIPHRFIVVEGPIGVGKTSFARRLGQSLGGQLVLEQADQNPFLERFYKNPRAAAFQTQLFFLFQRVAPTGRRQAGGSVRCRARGGLSAGEG